MIRAINMWWHRDVLGHTIEVRRVSIPMIDPSVTGYLWRCITEGCGKVWIR